MGDEPHDKEVALALQRGLNTHGHGFQYAVLRRLEQLRKSQKSDWLLERTEVPVEVRGTGTRIDFILRRDKPMSQTPSPTFYMLAECKRANPAFLDWCFVRAPYTGGSNRNGYVILDKVRLDAKEQITTEPFEQYVGTDQYGAYHIAVEVKGTQEGDRHGTPKGAIEEAATQVLRAVNGMVNLLASYPSLLERTSRRVILVPVIFTTAHLWASDVDLGMATLQTGNIDLSSSGFQQKPWLLYQYNMSPGLKHTQAIVGKVTGYDSISEIIQQEYLRTIAVVSATGIDDFLNWSHWLDTQ